MKFKNHYIRRLKAPDKDVHPISDEEDFGTYLLCLKMPIWCQYGLDLKDFDEMYFL